MEKIMVVAGIWFMCALCAVLFVRGASTPAMRRVKIGQNERSEARDYAGR